MNQQPLHRYPVSEQSFVWANRERELTDHKHNQDEISFLLLTKTRRLIRQIHQLKIILTQSNIAKRLIVEDA